MQHNVRGEKTPQKQKLTKNMGNLHGEFMTNNR